MVASAHYRCIACASPYRLDEVVYTCRSCGALLEVHQPDPGAGLSPAGWRARFEARPAGQPGPDGSGVWRFREWVLPELPEGDIVTLGEGATALVEAPGLGGELGVRLLVKQCGHSATGSFKDLGMTVLVSQVRHLVRRGLKIPALACASTGDTSAALAAYGAAAGLRTLVLLPSGMVSRAQLIQPLAHGARVLAVDTDFDGCMQLVARLADDDGVYLANSKNSLRIEGQKTVAFEIAQGLQWELPDWVAIPGGNLGNVSALVKGFALLRDVGFTTKLPRVLCVQTDAADPLARSFRAGFAPLEPVQAKPTAASAIRIGNPVSFPKAVAALKACDGIVSAVSEAALAEAAVKADAQGFYLCPHTAVALAGAIAARREEHIRKGETVVVVSTAHGLKFTEFKSAHASEPIAVANDLGAVRKAALS